MRRVMLPDAFAIRMAWRDARKRRRRLLLFSAPLIAGVAALVAILSFRADLLQTVELQARELLGADLEIRSNQPWPEEMATLIDSIGGQQATALEFTTMVRFGETGETRLSQIRAISGGYPFYGELGTIPKEAAARYQQISGALVEKSLMDQAGLAPGDSIHLGGHSLPSAGALVDVPGESAAFSLAGPRIYLPREIVEGGPLMQRGSRIRHKVWFQLESERELAPLQARLEQLRRNYPIRVATVESELRRFESTVDNLFRYLALVSFIALLMGGIGVAGSAWLYGRQIAPAVATLRCLGASTRQTVQIFTLQIAAVTLAGSAIGSLSGVLLQRLLPRIASELLPFELATTLSPGTLLAGTLIGAGVGLASALLPIHTVAGIPPMLTLRVADLSATINPGRGVKAWMTLASALLFILLTGAISGDWRASLLFSLGLLATLLALLLLARTLVRTLRSLRLHSLPFSWRQGISNLFRPNNQTTLVLVTLGMGVMLLGTLHLSQEMLLDRIRMQTGGEQPTLVFYDIQMDQQEELHHLIADKGATLMEHVPIVTMRLDSLKGRSVRELRADTTAGVGRWVLNREYRVTYRERLTEAERLTDGEWISRTDGLDGEIPISLESSITEELQVQIGDRLTFDLQGVPIRTRVASVREVDFQQPRPNFFVLFPAGALESAPQFFASVVRSDPELTPTLQREATIHFPNVSAIDIALVLESVERFLGQISLGIRFMALFTLLAGMIVLAVSMSVSRRQREREATLLYALGAGKGTIRRIQRIEYLLMGLLASLAGLLLALVAGWLTGRYWFELPMRPEPLPLIAILAATLLLTLSAGRLSDHKRGKKDPMELLKEEVE